MEKSTDPNWVSMTRLGAEFGWSVREIARILDLHGYRKGARPTPQGRAWVQALVNPVGEEVYRWNLPGMVARLVEHGYQLDDRVCLESRLLWQACEKYNDFRHKYFKGPKRKQEALDLMKEYGAQMRHRLEVLPPRQRAQVLVNLETRMTLPKNEAAWGEYPRAEAFKWLRISRAELDASALLLATPDPASKVNRPRL